MNSMRTAALEILKRRRMVGSRPLALEEIRASALVIAPHPDDEVLGCGGLLTMKRMEGARIRIIVLGDGGSSHARQIDRKTLVMRRKNEALGAGEKMGIEPGGYRFLAIPDGSLFRNYRQVFKRLKLECSDFEPEQILFPHRLDLIQSDHFAAWLIVRDLVRTTPLGCDLYEYPVWYYYHWPWCSQTLGWKNALLKTVLPLSDLFYPLFPGWLNSFLDISEVIPVKRAALSCHLSQVEAMDGRLDWPVLSDLGGGDFLQHFFERHEWFYRYGRKGYLE